LQVRMEASKQERPEIDRSRSNSCIQRIARERDSNLIRVEPLVAITLALKPGLSSRDRLTHMLHRKLTLSKKVDGTESDT